MCKAGPTIDTSWIIQVTCEAKAEAEGVLFLLSYRSRSSRARCTNTLLSTHLVSIITISPVDVDVDPL
jgi:hypothetical protein